MRKHNRSPLMQQSASCTLLFWTSLSMDSSTREFGQAVLFVSWKQSKSVRQWKIACFHALCVNNTDSNKQECPLSSSTISLELLNTCNCFQFVSHYVTVLSLLSELCFHSSQKATIWILSTSSWLPSRLGRMVCIPLPNQTQTHHPTVWKKRKTDVTLALVVATAVWLSF